jgi:hypothetical protein
VGKCLTPSAKILKFTHTRKDVRHVLFVSVFHGRPFSQRLLHFLAVQPSTQVVKLGKNIPKINGAFIAPSATVAGKVEIAKGASVWYGAVLRGKNCERIIRLHACEI